MDKNVLMKKYRWVIWGIMALAYMIVFFQRLAPGVVREDLTEAFDLSSAAFANLGSMYFYAYMLMQIPTGILVDSLGARITVFGGMLLAGLGSIVFGLATQVELAYAARILVGLGVSVVFVAILKIQSMWFSEQEFATMSGLTSFVGNLGGFAAQTPLALLVAVLSWRNTFLLIGFFTLGISVLCFLLIRNDPADMGWPAVNSGITEKQKNPRTERGHFLQDLFLVAANWRIYPSFFIFAVFYGSLMSLMAAWGVSYLVAVYGMTRLAAANYISVVVMGVGIGSLIIGKVSDFIKSRKIPMYVAAAVNVMCWAYIVLVAGGKPPIDHLYPLFFVLGLSNSLFVLVWACSKEVNPPDIAGTSTSVVNVGGFLGGAVLPVIIGQVLDTYGSFLPPESLYQKAFLWCLYSALAGLLLIIPLQETRCRNIYHEIER